MKYYLEEDAVAQRADLQEVLQFEAGLLYCKTDQFADRFKQGNQVLVGWTPEEYLDDAECVIHITLDVTEDTVIYEISKILSKLEDF